MYHLSLKNKERKKRQETNDKTMQFAEWRVVHDGEEIKLASGFVSEDFTVYDGVWNSDELKSTLHVASSHSVRFFLFFFKFTTFLER